MTPYLAVIIGCSAGGIEALSKVLSGLPAKFPIPIIIVSHQSPDSASLLASVLACHSKLTVQDAEEKELPQAQRVYVAPPNYHLLIDDNGTFALTVDPKVLYSRPSIDVTFETAAEYYQQSLIGIMLTGANSDGTQGAKMIKKQGGVVIVQNPETAVAKSMPQSVIAAGCADYIIPLEGISTKLLELTNWNLYECK